MGDSRLEPLVLSGAERLTLQGWARRLTTAQGLAKRARIVLACADGLSNTAVAARPGGPVVLAPDVALHSAMLTRTLHGQQNVEAYHQLINGIQGERTYLARFTRPAGSSSTGTASSTATSCKASTTISSTAAEGSPTRPPG
jgi:hypothetical protein